MLDTRWDNFFTRRRLLSTSSLASSDSHCSLVTSSPLQQVVTRTCEARCEVTWWGEDWPHPTTPSCRHPRTRRWSGSWTRGFHYTECLDIFEIQNYLQQLKTLSFKCIIWHRTFLSKFSVSGWRASSQKKLRVLAKISSDAASKC